MQRVYSEKRVASRFVLLKRGGSFAASRNRCELSAWRLRSTSFSTLRKLTGAFRRSFSWLSTRTRIARSSSLRFSDRFCRSGRSSCSTARVRFAGASGVSLDADVFRGFTDLGRWWGNDPQEHSETEIDVVAADDGRTVAVGECKWRERACRPCYDECFHRRARTPALRVPRFRSARAVSS